MDPAQQDASVRKAAFDWLEAQQARHGDVLPRDVLSQGFTWQDERVPLVSAQGIFKPRVLPEIPLTITTSPNGPYEDSFADDYRLLYRYRGTDPSQRDNVGLQGRRRANASARTTGRLQMPRVRRDWPDPNRLTKRFEEFLEAQDIVRK